MSATAIHRDSMVTGIALGVVALQVLALGGLILDPSQPPRAFTFLQVFWAYFHQPAFGLVVVLMIFGPPLTWLACTYPGNHRKWLAWGWGIFLVLALAFHGARLGVMLKLLWITMWL